MHLLHLFRVRDPISQSIRADGEFSLISARVGMVAGVHLSDAAAGGRSAGLEPAGGCKVVDRFVVVCCLL